MISRVRINVNAYDNTISIVSSPGNKAEDIMLLINVVAAGMNYMYLNIARGKAYSLNDLFYFYRHHPEIKPKISCC